ncbi:MAG TPA: CRISPR-associated endonuclease Cas1 [Deltaproteobacteria bacterium]|nr:CRISPR-associated endonuclease Cas1 [Deltaproteobacteria bacterium]
MAKTEVERIHPEREPEAAPLPPAQYNLFTGEAELVALVVDEAPDDELVIDDGIRMVRTDDSSRLVLSGYGIFLSKKSERMVVRKGKDVIYQFPFFRLCDVVVASRGVGLSSDLIEELCRRGINLYFLSGGSKPYAMLTSPMLTATVEARRCQFDALNDARGVEFSKAVVYGKTTNQERLLRYFGKYIKDVDPERYSRVASIAAALRELRGKVRRVRGAKMDEVRDTLMGMEGTAGRLYWDGVKEVLANRTEFMGRRTRGAADPANSLLNYGYGILYSVVWGALVNAGLEPFAGFLHVDRPGKPSLVLDLVEEFRQPVVDRTVIAHINLGREITMVDGLLDGETRSAVAGKILARLDSQEKYEGRRYRISSIIQIQARNLASFLRGRRPYRPFTFRW